MFHSAVLVEGNQSVKDVIARLQSFGDNAHVVIRLKEAVRVFWFVRTKAEIMKGCENVEQAYGRGTETPLGVVLKLKTSQASTVFDQQEFSTRDLQEVSGVLVRGRRLLGVLIRNEVMANAADNTATTQAPEVQVGTETETKIETEAGEEADTEPATETETETEIEIETETETETRTKTETEAETEIEAEEETNTEAETELEIQGKGDADQPTSLEDAFARLSKTQQQDLIESVLAKQGERETLRRESERQRSLSSRISSGLIKSLSSLFGKTTSRQRLPQIVLGDGEDASGPAKGGLGGLLGGLLGGGGSGGSKESKGSVSLEDLMVEFKKHPDLMKQTGGVRGGRPNSSAPHETAGSEPDESSHLPSESPLPPASEPSSDEWESAADDVDDISASDDDWLADDDLDDVSDAWENGPAHSVGDEPSAEEWESAGDDANDMSASDDDRLADDGLDDGVSDPWEGSPAHSVGDEPSVTRERTVKNDVVFPKLEAPERVEMGSPFTLELSLTQERSEAPRSVALNFSGVTETSTFPLQILLSAPGFTVKHSSFREVSVDPSNYKATREVFELTATDALEGSSIHTLRVQFFYRGNPIGEAFHEVAIGLTPEEPLNSGSTRMNEAAGMEAPDLTVVINEADQSGYLAWSLNSPHEIDSALKEQVDNRLGSDSGKTFAHFLTKGIPLRDHNKLLGKTLLGAGRQISRVVPKQFWQALAQVWAQLEPGTVPRVLIVSNDPYIPWELATVEPPYMDDSLVDSERPLILSAQVIVGRWLALASEHTAALYPQLPPPIEVKPEKMAVIVGDYLAINGQRPLPEADAEGETLLGKYKGIKLNAVVDDLLALMDNAVEDNGQAVDISMMHFACHGEFDVNRPQDNGIVLNDNTRFDPGWAMSNSIGRETQPFAFMNACDVGAANDTLGGYGGFAGAFINEGFTGFIAPLWAVNDSDAREFAVEFYTKTLEHNMTVGEAVRELRTGLFADPDKPASTYVSYMLYAHPDLRLELVT